MPRPVVCPQCGEDLDIPPEYRGREVRCAGCGHVFTPPPQRASESPPARQLDDFDADLPTRRSRRDEDRSYHDDDDALPRRQRRKRKSGSLAWLWILLAGGILFCGLPCGGLITLGVIVAFPDFEAYDDPAGRFRGEFPGQPFTYSNKTEDGHNRHCVESKRSFPPETYYIHVIELPRNDRRQPQQVLQGACDRAVARVPGGLDGGRSSLTIDGYQVEQVMIEHADGGTTIVRCYLAGRRLYEVGITCEQGIEMDEPRAQHFFDAFKIKGTGN